MAALEKLVSISSKPLMMTFDSKLGKEFEEPCGLAGDLLDLLALKNGFYAFESALHVFPLSRDNWFNDQDIQRWNDVSLWKHAYNNPALGEMIAFAEDIIGVQFCLQGSQIVRFDPETGDTEEMCSTLDEWAEILLSDYSVELAYPLAHEWQKYNGPLLPGNRLIPIVPLIAEEGTFNFTNFYQLDAVKGMLVRADLAMQLKTIPDGQAVTIQAINVPKKR